jgi:hypothetical protein
MCALRADAIERVAERVRREPAFARVIAELVEAPISSGEQYRHAAAQALNRQRLAQAVDQFKQGALVTAQVQELLGFKTPQAVHRLRSRGKLLGKQIGNATYFPAWQFADGQLRPDLPQVLELLTAFGADVIGHDRVMRMVHEDLGGRSIAESLDRPKFAPIAWVILRELDA